jgi:quinoprotein glucose dehydrogenase
MLLAVLIAIAGLVIAAGGAWLLALGGSWYYLIAGIGLIATAAFMFRGSRTAIWIYAATFVFTLIWAFWEAGTDGWALMPRLLGPAILLVFVLLTFPVLRRDDTLHHRGAAAALLLLGGALGLAGPITNIGKLRAQEQGAAPAAQPADPSAPEQTVAGSSHSASHSMRQTGADWPAWGGTHHGQKYSPLTQITRENVGQLTKVWEFRTGDMPEPDSEGRYAPENTPLKIGDTLYVCSAMGKAIALNALTGREEWRYDPQVSEDAIPFMAICRGLAYYEVPDAGPDEACATRIIWGTMDARLLAVDAKTGQLCTGFGTNGAVALERGIGDTVPGWYAVTSPPTIVRGIVVTGAAVSDGNAEDSPSGVVRGYDAVTGEFRWAWDMGRPGVTTEPAEGETYTRGTPNMWTVAAGDEQLGYVYLPLGNSAVDYYGSNRSDAENTYSSALVALDVTTGMPVWHYQTVHRDVWDYDLGSQPTLVDVRTAAGTVPAVVLASKQGDIYVLDRRSGQSLFPVEERPVPQGGVEPSYLSPTQPFSTFNTVARPPLEEKDMWGMSPIDQLWCRIRFRSSHYEGMYTPPTTDRRWIQYPAYMGGIDWGGVAVDPVRGLVIANYSDVMNHNRLVPREEVDRLGVTPINAPRNPNAPEDLSPQVGAPYGIDVDAGWRINFTALMCKKPPYGGIRAIDLATGEIRWDRPLGSARRNGPFRIPSMLPFTIGTPNNGGAAVTAGGLIFIAASTDNMFRAIDIETGEVLWSDLLPAGGQAAPIVAEVNGRQFVIIGAGGHHFMETPIGDYMIAYALPEE